MSEGILQPRRPRHHGHQRRRRHAATRGDCAPGIEHLGRRALRDIRYDQEGVETPDRPPTSQTLLYTERSWQRKARREVDFSAAVVGLSYPMAAMMHCARTVLGTRKNLSKVKVRAIAPTLAGETARRSSAITAKARSTCGGSARRLVLTNIAGKG